MRKCGLLWLPAFKLNVNVSIVYIDYKRLLAWFLFCGKGAFAFLDVAGDGVILEASGQYAIYVSVLCGERQITRNIQPFKR